MPHKNEVPLFKKETRQRILDAATIVFQKFGYARTSMHGIADQAEVAEVTIFRHFGSKQKLFQLVISQIGESAKMDDIKTKLTGDLHNDLMLICHNLLAFFIAQQEIIRMLMFESSHFPEVLDAVAKNPAKSCLILSEYFQNQMKQGRIKNIDPDSTARVFISTIFGYAISLHSLDEYLSPRILPEVMAEQFVHIFLEGTMLK